MPVRRLLLFAAFAWAVTARAADWPQWRGPERTDVSAETGLRKSWPAARPKTPLDLPRRRGRLLGAGRRRPALYTMGAENKKEYLYRLDTQTLQKVWSAEIGPVFTDGHGDGPRGTPTVDGDRVYALGAQGELVCVAAVGGRVVWRKNLAPTSAARCGPNGATANRRWWTATA